MNYRPHLFGYLHPLSGSSIFHLLNLLLKNGGVSHQYLPKIIVILVMSCLTTPLILLEKQKFERKIADTQLKYAPIFIIGHWRSGTTHLHNLISRDPQFGYLNTLQAFRASEISLIAKKPIEQIAKKQFPLERPMDRVKIEADSPQEEEFALANSSAYSFYHGFYFPQKMRQLFEQFVFLDRQNKTIKQQWEKLYIQQIKKIAFSSDNKRLIIKNPVNTGRIKVLLELFPEAKFIHIYRNPYSTYISTKKMYQKILNTWSLQNISDEAIEENILWFYQVIMQEYLTTKALIPEKNLVEIKYEDFVGNEIKYLTDIYQQFELPNFTIALKEFELYLQSQSKYERNNYQLDEDTIAKVERHWQFALQEWQYSNPYTTK
jgi:omega-hydroxy-beta-dihydromenaquinone-9 sulfotransferase